MPILHIEFNPTGGTLFEIKYKPISSTNWQTATVTSSPFDVNVPTTDPYEYSIRKICSPDNDSIEIFGNAVYVPPCQTPEFTFVSRLGNQFKFDYLLVGTQPQFDIEITAPSGAGVNITRYQSSSNTSPITIVIPNIQTGMYRFRMRGVCGVDVNSAVSNWSNYIDVNIVVNTCQPPSAILTSNNYPSYYGGASGLGGNLFQIQTSLNISMSLAETQNQGTASRILEEILVYSGYNNANSYGDIKIVSLPNRGTITVHGQDLSINDVVPLSETSSNTFEFWPTGSAGDQPFGSYSTSFQYIILDGFGNEIDFVTLTIQFN